MRAALQRAGLTVRLVAAHGVDPYVLVAGLRKGRTQTVQPSTEANYRLNESLSGRRAGMIVKRTVNVGLTASRLGDTLVKAGRKVGR